MTVKLSKCKRCGAQIAWVKTTKGKQMPCNFPPFFYWISKNGENPGRVVTRSGETIACSFKGAGEPAGIGYEPHFGNCKRKEKNNDCNKI